MAYSTNITFTLTTDQPITSCHMQVQSLTHGTVKEPEVSDSVKLDIAELERMMSLLDDRIDEGN